ncbi:NAD(P)-dependent oxidoreductase [Bacteroides reticulotermitis]|uniref:Glutamate synthase n=2 Tax=Bacteroides reticulotermitis TaxID=1133319 RepID=W4V087_9BACE|nr:NAD(P)-dependent oxidoreductase [Bacteroides reticulotermitis]MBB4044156.1 glutamate synthase (NADPH/NADH) small chain [Bacteroides reticulotermitis]GAE86223.1 glutamate synthase [Bacteroides reticulotermitis JCM 10512]HJD74784.1 NAD(P)-dependent oxidoreductase [Bacteroides reticulotermitis]
MTEKNNTFKEINESFTTKEAIEEAKRCLNCKNPSCRKGCPIENDIPGFIHQLSMGNMGDAMHIINEKSNLPAICGRVCPHEKQCQGHCILYPKGKEIQIGKLERFIADFDTQMSLIRERLPQKTRGKVAVIGSGPAGLTVAGDLARQGFNVTIFDSQEEAGGVLMYGIPEYRLPKVVVRKEIAKMEALGITFTLNCVVGKDITIDQMFEQDFDAIFIGTGTALPKALNAPGAQLRGIIQSSYLLQMVSIFNEGAVNRDAVPVKQGEKVGIIGCGNVAMDAARTAIRMGASSVHVIYHRTEADMPAIQSEYQEAVKEGVQFMWQTSTEEFIGNEDGALVAIRATTPEGKQEIPFDRICLAIGSRPANRIVSTTTGIDVDDTGYVIVKDRPYGMTTRRGVFAGGDVVHHPQTVVMAMKAAKQVATGIAQYVDAIKLLEA